MSKSGNTKLLLGAAGGLLGVGLAGLLLKSKKKAAAKKLVLAEAEAGSSHEELTGFERLSADYLGHIKEKYGISDAHLKRLETMLAYNCVGGKVFRGTLVLDTVKALCIAKGLDYSKVREQAVVAGWCVEILQAYFLVADDIMDKSETRRGKPCWFRIPEIQMDAINDSFILSSFIYFLLFKHFGHDKDLLLEMNRLFQEVTLQTEIGQMLDLTSQPQGLKDPALLATFTPDLHRQIIINKTSIYTFYLPIAAGMLITGFKDKKAFDAALAIATELGVKFQTQDDFLDCFGDYDKMGKIGTDIQDHKCTWLLAMALLRVTADQRRLLETHLGKDDQDSVTRVRELYRELGLVELYQKQEEESQQRILDLIQQHAAVVPPQVFLPILRKVHGREK